MLFCCSLYDGPAAVILHECHVCCICDSSAAMLPQDLVTPLETPVTASHGTADQAIAPLSTCLEDLPQGILMGLCQAGAAHRMPLTVALVSERARKQAAATDSLAWRDLVAGTLALCGCVHLLWLLQHTVCCLMESLLSLCPIATSMIPFL